jgi:hypothetical protein
VKQLGQRASTEETFLGCLIVGKKLEFSSLEVTFLGLFFHCLDKVS